MATTATVPSNTLKRPPSLRRLPAGTEPALDGFQEFVAIVGRAQRRLGLARRFVLRGN